jgi:hypothetical protein
MQKHTGKRSDRHTHRRIYGLHVGAAFDQSIDFARLTVSGRVNQLSFYNAGGARMWIQNKI